MTLGILKLMSNLLYVNSVYVMCIEPTLKKVEPKRLLNGNFWKNGSTFFLSGKGLK